MSVLVGVLCLVGCFTAWGSNPVAVRKYALHDGTVWYFYQSTGTS